MLTSVQDNPEKKRRDAQVANIKENHVKTHKNAEKLTKTLKKHIK